MIAILPRDQPRTKPGAVQHPATIQYPMGFKDQYVRLIAEPRHVRESEWAAICESAAKLGLNAELRQTDLPHAPSVA